MNRAEIAAAVTDYKAVLMDAAADLGFDVVRVTRPDSIAEPSNRLHEFIELGRHGDMGWLAANRDRRASPSALWPQARSVIMVGQSYAPAHDPMATLALRQSATISVYAQGRDYHDVLASKLKTLATRFAGQSGADVKVFVDTAPLMEKPLAAASGIGWQGKHTNLVSRDFGSWLFLGAILTTADMAADDPMDDHCGSCRRCLDICPTDAFPAPYQLDARRCLAYLTIEYKGHIAAEFREPLGNRVFGCDDCLAVCPWNKFAEISRETRFKASDATANPPLADLLALDDGAFRTRFAGTPVKRTGRNRVVRNSLIAAGNSGDRNLLPHAVRLLGDASAIVRAMAVWALHRLGDRGEFSAQRDVHLPAEPDEAVRREWHTASGTLG